MSSYMDPSEAPRFDVEPPRKGMSSGTKWLLGLGIGCGVVVLLCCGGFISIGYFAGTAMKQGATEDPAKVKAIADEITTLDIPAGLRPVRGLDLIAPFFGKRLMAMAMYEGAADEGVLFLAEFPFKIEDTDQQSLEQQMNAQMQGRQKGPQKMVVRESRSLDLTIRDKPARFVIQKGTLQDGAQPRVAKTPERPADAAPGKAGAAKEVVGAVGMFQGKDGAALLIMQLDGERFNEDDVEKALRSIR